MNNMITELRVLEEEKNIFDTNIDYIIPLYQRGYAWEDKQLIQLVEDICDIQGETTYYMGSLIVSKQDDKYEVVDGQQRLTSLFLLLHCLDIDVKPSLTFACREKSNYTLRNLQELLTENRSKLDMDRIEQGLIRGLQILKEELGRLPLTKDEIIEKLSRVVIYRIEVPKHTDLNRYFEIMNTRGEQLEQHDILKATLMSYLEDEKEKACFAMIWDACSDMTGYVQMHFTSRNNSVRNNLFGAHWNEIPSDDWKSILENAASREQESGKKTIKEISKIGFTIDSFDGNSDEETRVRFESIIDFPFFLLHVLKVYVRINSVSHFDMTSKIIDELLDDKKLIDSFNRVIKYGVLNGKRLNDNRSVFSRGFIVCLLRTRFLFDKYILKREFLNENADGEWSLKSIDVSGQQSFKKAYYKNTRFVKTGGWDKTNDEMTKENIMIQSALRVSYTSPKVMHWITKLLCWLEESNCKNCSNDNDLISGIRRKAESIAIDAVKENFFDLCQDNKYLMGVNTPHIVFNFLDYILWKNQKRKYDDFIFEFRNSVEHWYPRNPSEGTFEKWESDVDSFGNLCIIQRNVNSRFSNMSPEAKKSTFREMISKGSIKLRIMADLTIPNGDSPASLYWKNNQYKIHEERMIGLLKAECGIVDQKEP